MVCRVLTRPCNTFTAKQLPNPFKHGNKTERGGVSTLHTKYSNTRATTARNTTKIHVIYKQKSTKDGETFKLYKNDMNSSNDNEISNENINYNTYSKNDPRKLPIKPDELNTMNNLTIISNELVIVAKTRLSRLKPRDNG